MQICAFADLWGKMRIQPPFKREYDNIVRLSHIATVLTRNGLGFLLDLLDLHFFERLRPHQIVFHVPAQFFLFLRRERELDAGVGLKVCLIGTLEREGDGVLPCVERLLTDVECCCHGTHPVIDWRVIGLDFYPVKLCPVNANARRG